MNNVTITPNTKMIESLRYLTYKNHTALADLVDNSLDAEATQVDINIDKEKKTIQIIDNGTGMDLPTLVESVKLGSDTNKDGSDLGRFGMGLVTASISMARRLEVTSLTAGGEIHKVVLDLDHIMESGNWEATIEEPEMQEIISLQANGHGTVVYLSHIDKLEPQIIGKSKAHFGETFRKFIDSGRKIFINEERVLAYDPLESAAESTDILYDEEAEINGKIFHLKIAHVGTDISRLSEGPRNYNQPNQGFYVVRNNRQIAAGIDLGIINKHNDFNRFRAEIDCSSEFDDILNINFTKDEINATQAMRDKINMIVRPYLDMIRTTDKKQRQVNESQKISHSDAEEIIKRRKSLLPTTNGTIEKRATRSSNTKAPKSDQEEPKPTKERKNFREIQVGAKNFPAIIKEVDLGPNGDLFEDELNGSQLEIHWNIQHPFHTEIMAKYSTDKNITTPMDLLIYSIVWSKHMLEEDDQQLIFSNAMNIMSNTLRTLMKQ